MGDNMGIKRRSLFNPKFQNSRKRRWELGRSKLQQKLYETGQLKAQEDNSVMIEKVKEEGIIMTIQPYEEVVVEDNSVIVQEMDEIVESTPTEEIPAEKIEAMTNTVEAMIEEVIEAEEKPMPEEVAKPMNLSKLKKAELLKMAKAMNCEVTSKNTKAQIIEAIEKQST